MVVEAAADARDVPPELLPSGHILRDEGEEQADHQGGDEAQRDADAVQFVHRGLLHCSHALIFLRKMNTSPTPAATKKVCHPTTSAIWWANRCQTLPCSATCCICSGIPPAHTMSIIASPRSPRSSAPSPGA